MESPQTACHNTALDCRDAITADRVGVQVVAALLWQPAAVARAPQHDFFPPERHMEIHRLGTAALHDFVAGRTLGALLFEAAWQNELLCLALRALARGRGVNVLSARIVQLAESAAQRSRSEAGFLAAIRRRHARTLP